MNYIECPDVYRGRGKSLFLGGGISGCHDWQKKFAHYFINEDITIINPRRKDFAVDDPRMTQEQIEWEFLHLRKASAIMFWFPKETLCPITLYELGTHSMTKKPIFVGVEPQYARRVDVEIQTRLVRPDIEIVYDLAALRNNVMRWIATPRMKNYRR